MGTRTAVAAVVVVLGLTTLGCGTETEKLPELPKGPEVAPPAPVADTRPQSVPLGEPTRQTQSAIGGAYRSSLARIDDYAITHQLNLYQAEHGHYPRSNEEFHEKFMKGYKIPYPQMEEGYELFYNHEENVVYQRLIEEPADDAAGEAAEEGMEGAEVGASAEGDTAESSDPEAASGVEN